jgi:hypothetical protein
MRFAEYAAQRRRHGPQLESHHFRPWRDRLDGLVKRDDAMDSPQQRLTVVV